MKSSPNGQPTGEGRLEMTQRIPSLMQCFYGGIEDFSSGQSMVHGEQGLGDMIKDGNLSCSWPTGLVWGCAFLSSPWTLNIFCNLGVRETRTQFLQIFPFLN